MVTPAVALPEAEFVSTWDTRLTSPPPPWDPGGGSTAANQIHLPLRPGSHNFTVGWGDGASDAITSWNQAETTHTYATPGVYQLTITGTLVGWGFAGAGDHEKILSVTSWGQARLGNGGQYFRGASNLVSVPAGLDLTGTTNLESMFQEASAFTGGGRAGWDVSQVTNMTSMFDSARSFNEDIGDWDVGNVTALTNMFAYAATFNQDIGGWDVGNVSNMDFMFREATSFDQDISGWNVTSLTTAQEMFRGIRLPVAATTHCWRDGVCKRCSRTWSSTVD